MTLMPLFFRRPISAALLSNRSMSIICTLTSSLIVPVSCHCQVVRGGWELTRVGTPVLVAARAEIADDLDAFVFQATDQRGAAVEQIDVDHLHVDVLVDRAGELPLPGRPRRMGTDSRRDASSRSCPR